MKFFLNGKNPDSMARDLSNGLNFLTFEENFPCFVWAGTIDAGEETAILNKLIGPSGERLIPNCALFIEVQGPPTVSRGETAWNDEYVYLKNWGTSVSTAVKVVFLRDNNAPETTDDSNSRLLQIDYSTPPTDDQVPVYDASDGFWKPGTISPTSAAFQLDTYVPTISVPGGSTLTIVGSPTISTAEYCAVGDFVWVNFRATLELGGTADREILFTLPTTTQGAEKANLAAEILLSGATYPLAARCNTYSTTEAVLTKYDASTIAIGAGVEIGATGWYRNAEAAASGTFIGILGGFSYP